MSPTPFSPSSIQALLFDLDGTLIDSTADLVGSGNGLRARVGFPPLDAAVIASYVGDGVEALVRRLLVLPEGDVRGHVEAFMLHYREHCLDGTRLYDGVEPALRALAARGYRLAVVTNKPERVSRRILGGLGVDDLFGSIVGGDSCSHKKPHADPLWKACADLSILPAQALMIGDSRVDVEAGRNAGMASVGLLGGIGDQELLRTAGADVLISGFDCLLEIL